MLKSHANWNSKYSLEKAEESIIWFSESKNLVKYKSDQYND